MYYSKQVWNEKIVQILQILLILRFVTNKLISTLLGSSVYRATACPLGGARDSN